MDTSVVTFGHLFELTTDGMGIDVVDSTISMHDFYCIDVPGGRGHLNLFVSHLLFVAHIDWKRGRSEIKRPLIADGETMRQLSRQLGTTWSREGPSTIYHASRRTEHQDDVEQCRFSDCQEHYYGQNSRLPRITIALHDRRAQSQASGSR